MIDTRKQKDDITPLVYDFGYIQTGENIIQTLRMGEGFQFLNCIKKNDYFYEPLTK